MPLPLNPDLLDACNSLLTDAIKLAHDNPELPGLQAVQNRLNDFRATILVAGLRSVGKSSFVCALWGDSELLPTAERDCTQTNTLIRVPKPLENDQRIFLDYLPRAAAIEFAVHGIAYHRIATAIQEALGPGSTRFDEMPAEQKLRKSVAAMRKMFASNPKFAILNENLTDDIKEIEQFLAFIDSYSYRDGEVVEAKWADRREHLMGKRHPDGRTLDVGPLLALRNVAVIRRSACWGDAPPALIDTPYIPNYHNARRMDLILAQARLADALLILSRPQLFEPEEWVLQIFKERPELAERTVVVFNQADTADITQLFSREGFMAAYEESARRLAKIGIEVNNLYVSCARLPFLEASLNVPGANKIAIGERVVKLRAVLDRIRKAAESRPEGIFKNRLLAACNGKDCGTDLVRQRLQQLAAGPVYRSRFIDVLDAFDRAAAAADSPVWWQPLQARAAEFRTQLKSP